MESVKSRLGLGCWAFGGDYWPDQAQKDSLAVLRKAYEEGLRRFDSAAAYGRGKSEQLLGQRLLGPLAPSQREEITVATKGLYHPPAHMEAGIRKSLRRLQTDYIDIYYIHWPKPDIDLRPMVEALEELRTRGLIRHIGLSNFSVREIRPLLEAGRIDYCQFGYNLLWRLPERSLIPFCREQGIRMVTYGSLAEGLLAGPDKLPSLLRPEDPRRNLVLFRPGVLEAVEESLRRFFALAEKLMMPPARLALRWNLSRPWADTVLFGARNPLQLEENAGGIEAVVEDGALEEIGLSLSPLFEEDENIFGHRPR